MQKNFFHPLAAERVYRFEIGRLTTAQPHIHNIFSCRLRNPSAGIYLVRISVNQKFGHHGWMETGTASARIHSEKRRHIHVVHGLIDDTNHVFIRNRSIDIQREH